MRQFLKRHNDLSYAYEYQHETAKFVVQQREPSANDKNYILPQLLYSNFAYFHELLLISIIYAIFT